MRGHVVLSLKPPVKNLVNILFPAVIVSPVTVTRSFVPNTGHAYMTVTLMLHSVT